MMAVTEEEMIEAIDLMNRLQYRLRLRTPATNAEKKAWHQLHARVRHITEEATGGPAP